MANNNQIVDQRVDVSEFEEEDEIDFLALLGNCWKHKFIIIFTTLIFVVVTFGYFKFIATPQYSSTAKMYVVGSTNTSNVSSLLSNLSAGTTLAKDYLNIVEDQPVLDQVISDLNLNMTATQLKKKLTVTNPTDTRFIEITATDADPQMAKRIVDDMADVSAKFISNKMSQDKPNVVYYGYEATSPSSPKVGRNTLIGGLVGFVLAIIILSILYLMKDSIMSPDDLEKKVGIKPLAVLPVESKLKNRIDKNKATKQRK